MWAVEILRFLIISKYRYTINLYEARKWQQPSQNIHIVSSE